MSSSFSIILLLSCWAILMSSFDQGLKYPGKVVIIGGGIHGVSTAYYLATKYGVPSTIVEQSKIAAAASGKSGGFLAREWGYGPTIQMHQVSYDMHKELATDLNLESYRELKTISVDGNKKGLNIPSWLNKKSKSELMDSVTAQVTSLELTEKMLESAMKIGTKLLIDKVVGVDYTADTTISGVRLQTHGTLEADKIIICLGPWSGVAVEDWFGLSLPMQGVKSTSMVYHSIDVIREEPYACFCEEDSNHCHLELYPRPNGDLYICGCGGRDYITGDRLRLGGDAETAEHILADPARVTAALTSLHSITSIGNTTPDITQACMRPCLPDALPVMGKIPGYRGAYISAGHNCWGILWAPVSGLAMAEIMMEDTCTVVDVTPFDPSRYMQSILTAGKGSSQRGRKKGKDVVGEQW